MPLVLPTKALQPFIDGGCKYEYTSADGPGDPPPTMEIKGTDMEVDATAVPDTAPKPVVKTVSIKLQNGATTLTQFDVPIRVYPCTVKPQPITALQAHVG